jgi:signal transduction histidine kinase
MLPLPKTTAGAAAAAAGSVFHVDPGLVRAEPDREAVVRLLKKQNAELEYLVRALSHDLAASFLLLESSFCRLKRRLGQSELDDLGPLAAHVEACLRESKRLLDDLVGLARTGTVEMEPARVDLHAVLNEVLFEQGELVQARQAEIEVLCPLAEVWCNRHRFKQVLTNLIRNALRHGCDRQHPRIIVSAETGSDVSSPGGPAVPAERFVVLRVHDNGPGIDPRHHEEIFLPGRRLAQAAPEGSGMGLAIVRKIAEYYGGTAQIDAQVRHGTAFLVRLPQPPPQHAGSPAQAARPSGRLASGSRAEASKRPEQGLILHAPPLPSQPPSPHTC